MEDWKIRRHRDRIFPSREDRQDVDNDIIVRPCGELCAYNFSIKSKNIVARFYVRMGLKPDL